MEKLVVCGNGGLLQYVKKEVTSDGYRVIMNFLKILESYGLPAMIRKYFRYDFVIMMKGMKAFVGELLLGNRGSFENIREHSIRKYRVSGTTVKRKLYGHTRGMGEERYFHIL